MRAMPILMFVAVLTAFLAPNASAQTADTVTDSLVVEFQSVIGRAERLAEMRTSLAGEDSLIVVHEIEEGVVRAARILRDLAGRVAPDGDDVQPVDPAIAGEFEEMAALLWGAEAAVARRLDLARERLFEAAPDDSRALERVLIERERRMSLVYEVLTDHVLAMERIGLDTTANRERLIAAVNLRAMTLAARINFLQTMLGNLQEQVATYPDDASLVGEAQVTQRRRDLYLESLQATVQRLGDLDQPTAEFQNVLIRNTGDIANSILDPGVATSLFRDWWDHASEWVSDNGVGMLMKALFFVVIMLVFWGAARAVRKAVEHAMSGPHVRISHLLRKMIITFSGNAVLIAGFLIALSQTGVNLAPILAGLGVVGFIVGFALQETLANFAAGLMILFYRPYDVGDLVEVSGVFGTVNHMSLVSTTILTIDHQTLVVPNGKIWGDVIRNVTAQNVRRVDLVFGIGYSDDIPKAEKILMAILEDHEKILSSPEPVVKLHTLNESSVDFVVRPWVKTDDYWDVYWDVTREVKMRFDAEDVSIPFPQRDVHHYVDGLPAPPSEVEGEADTAGAGRSQRPAPGVPDDSGVPGENDQD